MKINFFADEKISKPFSPKESESDWQKLRERTSKKILFEKTETSNIRLKKLYETFDKLNQRIDHCKLGKDVLPHLKSNQLLEKTYRIPKNFVESTKPLKIQFENEFKDPKKTTSEVDDYLDKYAENFDKFKEEVSKPLEIHPTNKEVDELLRRLNIRDIGLQEFEESPREEFQNCRAVNRESQFSPRISLGEKEKIVKKLLSGKSEAEIDSFSKSQELEKNKSKPSIQNLMSTVFKSNYLRQDFNL